MNEGMSPRSDALYSALIIIQCIIFGLSFVVVKSLLEEGMPVFLLITIRFAIGAFFLYALSKLLNCFPKTNTKTGKNKNITKKELISGLIVGTILFLACAFQTVGADSTTPAKNGLFTDLFVIFVPIITMIFITKKFSSKPLLLAGLAFMGVMFIVDVFSEEMSFGIGELLSVICGLIFAIHFILMEKYTLKADDKNKLNPYNFTIIQLAIVALLGLIISLCTEIEKYNTISWGQTIIGGLIFLGILASAVAYLLQFLAQEKITAESVAILSCSEAIFVLIFALAFGFDKFSWLFIIGAMILITAMVLSSLTFNIRKGKKVT